MHRLYPTTFTVVFGLLCSLVSVTHAHDPGLSAIDLRFVDSQFDARLTFARREIDSLVPIDTDHDGSVSTAEFTAARPRLQTLARRMITISVEDQPVAVQVATVELDQSDALHVRVHFPWQAGSRLRVSTPIIAELARGHRQYVSVRDEQGNLAAEHMLDADHATFALALENTAMVAETSPSWRQFLLLGIEHMVTGYDHLLFLFGVLMMGGSLCSSWRIITSFTLAHSITLALVMFNMVHLPSSLVEPLIAASIMYVGLENLCRRDLHRRWLLTFGFGLVHGLGFASVLRDLGIGVGDGSGVVVPLLGFNVGVELGQMTIALLVLPLIWKSQQSPHIFPRLATACSIFVVLAGTYWLVERTALN